MAVFYDINLNDGNTVKATLNLGALMELSKKDKSLTDRYFKIYKNVQSENVNELEMGEIIYIAYRAANVKKSDYMQLEEFLYKLTDNRIELANIFKMVFGMQKKKQGSMTHLKG